MLPHIETLPGTQPLLIGEVTALTANRDKVRIRRFEEMTRTCNFGGPVQSGSSVESSLTPRTHFWASASSKTASFLSPQLRSISVLMNLRVASSISRQFPSFLQSSRRRSVRSSTFPGTRCFSEKSKKC